MSSKAIVELVRQIQSTTDPQALRELRKQLLELVARNPKR